MVGDFEEKIGDHFVRLRFGVHCVADLEAEWNTDTQGVMKALGKNAMSWVKPLYYAAKNYCTTHKVEFNLTEEDAIAWYEADPDRCIQLISEGFTSYFPKNSTSPTRAGNHIQLETTNT